MTWRHPSERHSWFKTTFRAGTRARARTEREEATTGKQVPASPVPSRSVSSKPVAENWDIVPDHFDDSKAGPAAIPGRAPRGASGTSDETGPAEGRAGTHDKTVRHKEAGAGQRVGGVSTTEGRNTQTIFGGWS